VVLHVIPAEDPTGTVVKQIDLIRDKIKLEERAAKKKIKEVPTGDGDEVVRLGVIELPEFYRDFQRKAGEVTRSCARDVYSLIGELKEEGVDGLLVDLRNNGGGSLPDAVEMTGFFIPEGPVGQGKSNRRIKPLNDPDPEMVYDGPLVVLVNRQSASASEIMAAALQDYGRAVVVGDSKTHGKGTVQSLLPLNPSSKKLGSLKLTTAGFYRVNGDTTQLQGMSPDIIIPSALDVMEIGEEFLPNVLNMNEIQRARYRQQDDLTHVIDALRTRSSERLDENEKYVAYQDLLRRLEERNKMEVLPLNFEARKALVRADRQLSKLQREQLGLDEDKEDLSDEEAEELADANDLILNETLRILADWVHLGYRPNPS